MEIMLLIHVVTSWLCSCIWFVFSFLLFVCLLLSVFFLFNFFATKYYLQNRKEIKENREETQRNHESYVNSRASSTNVKLQRLIELQWRVWVLRSLNYFFCFLVFCLKMRKLKSQCQYWRLKTSFNTWLKQSLHRNSMFRGCCNKIHKRGANVLLMSLSTYFGNEIGRIWRPTFISSFWLVKYGARQRSNGKSENSDRRTSCCIVIVSL